MRGVFASSVLPKPIVTLGSTTNFNQDRATINAIVDGQGLSTTVTAQYSSNGGSTYSTAVAMTGSPTYGSTAMYLNATGLTVGTSYIVRITATNAKGSTTVQNSNGNFTTWSLKTYLKSTSGSYTVSVPSITPTGGSAIAPTIYEMLIYGGGGGANYSGGGGGGYRIASTKLSSAAGTQDITGTVGAGGAGGNGGGGAGGGTAGGSTTLVVGNTTYTAGGGGVANWLTQGGASGTGDNTSRAGGTGNYGYTYVSGYNQWTDPSCGCCAVDKYGLCVTNCTCNNPNSPIYSTDFSRYAGGGGGGTDSAGTNATYPDGGGNGGNGGGAYGLNGGNGGRAGGTASNGSNGSVVAGGVAVGRGGEGNFGAGLAGGVTFKYYGP
jgi:hypothetical protein